MDFQDFAVEVRKRANRMKVNMTDVSRAARLIGKSKVMLLGMACEILALAAVVWNWSGITEWSWLPNATLTVATAGAFIVAWRIAWDYHGRGLNEEQRRDVLDIQANANLNEIQKEEVTEAVKSSGLTERQKSDLPAALIATEVADVVEAQKAADAADDYLDKQKPDHGHVVVIRRISSTQFNVQFVEPPEARGKCQRRHNREQGGKFSFEEIVIALLAKSHGPAVLWRHPRTGGICYTDRDDPEAFTNELVFSFEDCVPKWDVPVVGDYVLTLDPSDHYVWERKS